MADPVATGKFWRCGKCSKLVPMRQAVCSCGFERSAAPVNVAPPRASDDDESGPRWKVIGAALAILAVLGTAVAISRSAAPDPANSDLARRIRERRERANQPHVIYVPVPAAQALPTAVPTAVETPTLIADAELPDPVPDLPPPLPIAAAVVAVEAVQFESEIDIKRKDGILEFERSMVQLSEKADRADIAWGRFIEGCRVNVTTAFAAAGVADRDWIAVAYAGVTTRTWTDACAEAGAFFSLVGQVKDGMCVAEDRARMAWVLPGARRELRTKYRLGWDGWDRVCRG